MKKCKLCARPTKVVFNINFKAVPVCEGCACTVTMQQVVALCQNPPVRYCIEEFDVLVSEYANSPSSTLSKGAIKLKKDLVKMLNSNGWHKRRSK